MRHISALSMSHIRSPSRHGKLGLTSLSVGEDQPSWALAGPGPGLGFQSAGLLSVVDARIFWCLFVYCVFLSPFFFTLFIFLPLKLVPL